MSSQIQPLPKYEGLFDWSKDGGTWPFRGEGLPITVDACLDANTIELCDETNTPLAAILNVSVDGVTEFFAHAEKHRLAEHVSSS